MLSDRIWFLSRWCVNSKINFYGTNCAGYRPGLGYYPISYTSPPIIPPPEPGPLPPKSIGDVLELDMDAAQTIKHTKSIHKEVIVF